MKIIEKIANKGLDPHNNPSVCIAFLGDSVTHGCFEVYTELDNSVATVYEQKYSYPKLLAEKLALLYPKTPINFINAGISGDRASVGIKRVDRDVLAYNPMLVVVCYGLNDCSVASTGLDRYINSLEAIFDKITESGSEVIFMTPNMMCDHLSPHVHEERFIEIAKEASEKQSSGLFDKYIDAARELCKRKNIPVCDVYAIWKTFFENGVNTTELLSNKINHPTRELNELFAFELIKTMFS